MTLLGIAGTNGAGKDTVGEILATKHGWLFVSVTDILRDELKKSGQSIERENLRQLSAEWRRQFGHGILIDKAFEIYESHAKDYNGLAVASLRNPGEADEVHKLSGQVIWIDSDPKIRYERVYSRARGAEDVKSFSEFIDDEQAEMEHYGDDATLNMNGVKAKADIFIENNSQSLQQFTEELEKALSL
jgi:dephospho-CoA kinase